MPRRIWIFVCAIAVVVAGCASGSAGSGAPSSSGPRRDPNVISAAELDSVSSSSDLYTAIQQLRPAFLQRRGATSVNSGPSAIQVYVDGVHSGDESSLHQIRVSDTKQVKHLSASEATQLYGTGNTQGAILVTKK